MKYDLIIIGGGPAGMMAAGRAAELGARVLLLEKGSGLGAKLLMTGGGRCNITNASEGPKAMAARYNKAARFMRPLLYAFGPEDVVAFFNRRGVKTKVEAGGRVLPVSNDAENILDALISYMRAGSVETRLGSEVRDIIKKDSRIDAVVLSGGEEVRGRSFLIATGGRSYPASGSTGDGYGFARSLGHSIVPPRPALTTVVLEEDFTEGLEGLSLRGVALTLYKNNKKMTENSGDLVFTATGLGGPLVMDMSGRVGEALPRSVELRIDLVPASEFKELDERLVEAFDKGAKRHLGKSLGQFVPERLAGVIIEQAGVGADKRSGDVTREERKKLAGLLKEFTLRVRKVAGFERAFVTAGGVELTEVDPKTMRSKIINNLYFAGEVLDIDGPTGGYNLQVCWSTGYVAASAAAKK